ncbi:MAG: Replication factor A [Methanonatronarchaeales archaeon]|nr:Replication factor A [Methanonatronarchaeales archaeon]
MSADKKLSKALEQVKQSVDDFSERELTEELRELLEYGVPPDQAAETVIRRKGRSDPAAAAGEKKLADAVPGERGLTVEARVLDRRDRTIKVKGEPREIVSGSLGDETGVLSFTSWNEFPFEEGDAVRISNAYTREWNDRPELQVGDYTEVEEIAGEDLPPAEELSSPRDVSIRDASRAYRPRVEATVIDVLDRSGLVMRCPECNRVTEGGECSEHGPVDAEPDLRIKAVLDDGDSCIQATFPREVTESLTGVTLEEAEEMARKAMDRGVVQREMERVVGRAVVATGRVLGDNFVALDVEEPESSPEDDARELLEALQ